MATQQHQPFGKALTWTMVGIGAFSALFAGLLTLTAGASFLTAFLVIAAIFGAIAVCTLSVEYAIKPLWWEKLSEKSREAVRNWSVGALLVVIFILAPLGLFGGDHWQGQGQINLFPEGATSKNYRVDAEIEVSTKWWWHTDYQIDYVTWPDEGKTYFSNCIVGDGHFTCTDNSGENWRIEIEEAPDRPSSDD